MSTAIIYDFDWDAAKAIANIAKHTVTFDQAETVFADVLAHTYQLTEAHRVHIRIISARAATKHERHFYENEPR